jgi:hypothetical protein
MKRIYLSLVIQSSLLISGVSYGQNQVKDYLNISRLITFNKRNYSLAWSSHPSDNYYKQEYRQAGDTTERFSQMILIELVVGDLEVKDAVTAKVSELENLKKTNPVVNYQVISNKNTGEYMLDYLVSENTPDGKSINVLERNVYRYKKIVDKNGHQAILLFGVVVRSYGSKTTSFLENLKKNWSDLLNEVGQYELPSLNSIP